MQLACDQQILPLNGMLLGMNELNLLVPDNMVEEIFWPENVQPVANSPEWFKGYFSWNNRRIPLIAFEELNNDGAESGVEQFKAGSAVAIICGTVHRGYLPYYAVLVNDQTRLIELNKKSVAPDSGRHGRRAEDYWITVDNCSAVIPKMDWIEEHLLAYVLRPVN